LYFPVDTAFLQLREIFSCIFLIEDEDPTLQVFDSQHHNLSEAKMLPLHACRATLPRLLTRATLAFVLASFLLVFVLIVVKSPKQLKVDCFNLSTHSVVKAYVILKVFELRNLTENLGT